MTLKTLGVQLSRGPNVRGPSVPGVQMSSGSKCPWGPSVPGVQMSLGSKCPRGPSVPGVQVSLGSNCVRAIKFHQRPEAVFELQIVSAFYPHIFNSLLVHKGVC